MRSGHFKFTTCLVGLRNSRRHEAGIQASKNQLPRWLVQAVVMSPAEQCFKGGFPASTPCNQPALGWLILYE